VFVENKLRDGRPFSAGDEKLKTIARRLTAGRDYLMVQGL